MLTATLIVSVFITGVLVGFALLFLLVASFLKKEHNATVRKNIGEALVEIGGSMLVDKPAKQNDIRQIG